MSISLLLVHVQPASLNSIAYSVAASFQVQQFCLPANPA
jgi:hypothetical protein